MNHSTTKNLPSLSVIHLSFSPVFSFPNVLHKPSDDNQIVETCVVLPYCEITNMKTYYLPRDVAEVANFFVLLYLIFPPRHPTFFLHMSENETLDTTSSVKQQHDERRYI